jgi:hypothetical protein
MNSSNRSSLSAGILLILIGSLWLAVRVVPGLSELIQVQFTWPLIIVGFGLLMLITGLAAGNAEMAVPASFFMGLGAILYYQNTTGNWGSWAYAWTLFPGFVGVGQILAGLFSGKPAEGLQEGSRAVLVSAVMFLIFGSFLGGLRLFGPYWPVLLILAGVLILVQSFWKKNQ